MSTIKKYSIFKKLLTYKEKKKLFFLFFLILSNAFIEVISIGSIFPLVWLIRKLKRSKTIQSDLKQSSNLMNFLILNFLKIEKVLPVNRLFGTSVFISAKKY